MFDNLRKRIIEYCLKNSDNKSRNRSFVSWKQAASIELLYALPDGFTEDTTPIVSEISKIAAMCREGGKRLSFVVYAENGNLNLPFDNVVYINKKQLGFLTRRPAKEELTEFAGYDADLLINLTPYISYPIEYFAAVSPAKFKACLSREPEGAKYDFMVSTSKTQPEPLDIFKTIRHYLEQIASAD